MPWSSQAVLASEVIVGPSGGPQIEIDSTLNYTVTTSMLAGGAASDVTSIANIQAAVRFPSNNANETSPPLVAETLVTYTDGSVADALLILSGFTGLAGSSASFILSLSPSSTGSKSAAAIQGGYGFSGSAITLQPLFFNDANGNYRLYSSPGTAQQGLFLSAASDKSLMPAEETWHALALVNGWANDAAGPAVSYRLIGSPPSCVQLTGLLDSAASTAAQIGTVPASYAPPETKRFKPVLVAGALPASEMFGSIQPTGAVSLFNIPTAAGDKVQIPEGTIFALDI